MATEKSDFDKSIHKLQKLVDILRGKVNIRGRLAAILDPTNLQTSSRLSTNQVKFVTDSYWFATAYPELSPLKDYANELLATVISHEGKGREEAIAFIGALMQSEFMKKAVPQVQVERQEGKPMEKGKKQ